MELIEFLRGLQTVKITWNPNNAFSSRTFLPFSVTRVWFKDREKGSRDKSRRKFFFFSPKPPRSYLTRQCTIVPSMLISLTLKVLEEVPFFHAKRESFSVFRIDSGCRSYCRVVCEANIKLLLMIYWVGFNARLACLPCNLQYFNNNRRNGFISRNEIGDVRGDILRFRG